MSRSVLTRTLEGFASALGQALAAEQTARLPGLLQALDPRVKLCGLLALLLTAALSHRLLPLGALFVLGVVLALASRLNLIALCKRVWLVAFAFTALIALPALFLTAGPVLWQWPTLHLRITATGMRAALLLLTRVEAAVSFSTLLVLTTPWTRLLKALRTLFVPVEVVMLLAMTHRYIILLSETATQMFDARRARLVGHLNRREQRRLIVNTGGVLLSKSLEVSNQVYLAMQSRGFRGEVQLLDDFRLRPRDYAAAAAFALLAAAAYLAGR